MNSLLNCELDSLLWYIYSLKSIYEEGGKETVKRFQNFGTNTDEYDMICVEKMEDLPECKHHDFVYEEYEDSEETGDICGELWVFKSKEMQEFYQVLEQLKKQTIITEKQYDEYHIEMNDYILRVLVNKQYYDSGFYCHLDEGIENANDCRIEIYWYSDGSFDGFDTMAGISSVFEHYKETLKNLKEKYEGMITEVKNGT